MYVEEVEFITKVGMTIGDFVLSKLTRKYQTQQQFEDELSNVLEIMGVDVNVQGLASFLANNGYITIIDSNIFSTYGFELGSNKGGFSFFNSSIFDSTGTGIKASGQKTGITGHGNTSIKRTKRGLEFNVG